MGKHVDTTRPEDAANYDRLARWERELLTGIPTPSQAHRKPGEANDTPWPPPRDAWSGNAEDDKYWAK